MAIIQSFTCGKQRLLLLLSERHNYVRGVYLQYSRVVVPAKMVGWGPHHQVEGGHTDLECWIAPLTLIVPSLSMAMIVRFMYL
jgi:hypothetical protein